MSTHYFDPVLFSDEPVRQQAGKKDHEISKIVKEKENAGV